MSMVEIETVHDPTGLAVVTRMCMDTVLETIPEFGGSEEIARQHIPNFEFGQMLAMISRSAALPEHRILAAVSGSAIIGYSIISLKTDSAGVRYGYLFSRGVAPPFRRRGIATRLLATAEEWFLQGGAAFAQAETHEANVPLREFLGRNGFTVVDRGTGAWPFVVLRKTLGASTA